MRTFEDLDKRKWTLDLTLGTALRIDQADIVDIDGEPVKLVEGEPQKILKQVTKEYTILQLAGVMVQPQLTTGDVHTEFYERISKELLNELKYMVWGELSDFFPQAAILFSSLIESHKDLLNRERKLQESAKEKLHSQLNSIVDKAEAEALASIEELGTT